jgi:hypothetical protein
MPDVQFSFRGLDSFEQILHRWRPQVRKNLKEAFRDIATAWQLEAKRRVPVDTGLTRNTILKEHGENNNFEFYCAVGSNQKHAKYIEFGTKHIAGGRVKALGTGDDITDAQAVHSWPAKDGNAKSKTSASIDLSGKTKGRLRNMTGRFVKGAQEQMPWLRPSFMAIREKALGRLAKALQLD